jgi:hypothetical protein
MTPKELFESVGRSGIRKMHPGRRLQRRPGEEITGGLALSVGITDTPVGLTDGPGWNHGS